MKTSSSVARGDAVALRSQIRPRLVPEFPDAIGVLFA
jgi:hypothetical protein